MNKTDSLKIHYNTDIESDGSKYLSVILVVNNKRLVDIDKYGIDARALNSSIKNNGDYFIITCHCGDHGCAGIEKGIKVKIDTEYVYWDIYEPVKHKLKFSIKDVKAEIEKMNEKIENAKKDGLKITTEN